MERPAVEETLGILKAGPKAARKKEVPMIIVATNAKKHTGKYPQVLEKGKLRDAPISARLSSAKITPAAAVRNAIAVKMRCALPSSCWSDAKTSLKDSLAMLALLVQSTLVFSLDVLTLFYRNSLAESKGEPLF